MQATARLMWHPGENEFDTPGLNSPVREKNINFKISLDSVSYPLSFPITYLMLTLESDVQREGDLGTFNWALSALQTAVNTRNPSVGTCTCWGQLHASPPLDIDHLCAQDSVSTLTLNHSAQVSYTLLFNPHSDLHRSSFSFVCTLQKRKLRLTQDNVLKKSSWWTLICCLCVPQI